MALLWQKFEIKENLISMKGIGILVNILSVLVAGGFGVMLRGKLKTQYQSIMYRILGLVVFGVGVYEFTEHFFVLSGKQLELEGSLLAVVALVVGALLGYAFDMEGGLLKIGKSLSKKDVAEREKETKRLDRLNRAVSASIDKGITLPKVSLLDRLPTYDMPSSYSGVMYADGFLFTLILLSANSMLFSGVMADGLSGETTVLLYKSGIDFLVCFGMSMICGSAPMYAVLPMIFIDAFVYIGCMLLPDQMSSFFTPSLTGQLGVIGAVIMVILGIQMAFGRKNPKAANLVPAFTIPILYELLMLLITKLIAKE